ncbi:hypothetical protein [Streptomyces sp. MZ04]|uniref:hypothetical protein n=1 Tax=Streptomyces sp. MZ04 TaxID=2559236 RepID=UPI00107EA624|nr:hypothetical protein [Streptomyces sp. MZ04]TGB08584.1 hypothetical protein E2651_18580 [Streptomyces sp. MZ04]
MSTKKAHPNFRKFRFWLFASLLAFEAGLLLWSAAKDIEGYGRDQVLSALLRLTVAALIGGAFLQMYNNRDKRFPAPKVKSPWQYPLVLLAQAASLPMFFIPIWIELRSPVHTRGDWTWLAITLCLFLFATFILVDALVSGHVNFGWVAAGALLPLVGFFQFAYLTFYKPAHERPRVDVTAKVEKVNESRGVTRLLGVVTLKNNGAAAASVLGAMYTASGHRGELASAVGGKAHGVLDSSESNRHHFGKFMSLLAFDDLLASGDSIAPGETKTHSFVFDAPNNQQNFVRLAAYVSVSTPAGESKRVKCKGKRGGMNVCARTEYPPSSWAREILGDEPFALTKFHFDSMEAEAPEPPYISTVYGSIRGKKREEVQAVNPLARDQFTQSIAEYRLDP